jgi:hypothetical protein
MRQLSIATLALLTLTACGRKGARSSDFDSATAAALSTGTAAAQMRNMPKVAHVVEVQIGHGLDRHNMIFGGVATQFHPGDSILIAVKTQYLTAGSAISGVISQKNVAVDSAATKADASDSTGASFAGLRFQSGPKWAKGTYQAAIFIDGKFQVAQDFTITP